MTNKSTETQLALLVAGMKRMQEDVDDIKKKQENKYVTHDQLDLCEARNKLVAKIVFTLCGVLLLAVLGAIVNNVIQ